MAEIKDAQLNRLKKFIGYGNLDAPVWFVGMEEKGSEKTFAARLKFKKTVDLAYAHRKTHVSEHHTDMQKIQRTWRGMCVVMLVCDGKKPTRENIRKYQSEKLGRSKGKTLLTELFPIPKKKVTEWEYKKTIPQFNDLDDYQNKTLPDRIKLLRRIFKRNSPQIVICYGRRFWKYFREIFREAKFTRDRVGQFERAEIGETLIILCHHLTSRTMNKKIKKLALISRAHYV